MLQTMEMLPGLLITGNATSLYACTFGLVMTSIHVILYASFTKIFTTVGSLLHIMLDVWMQTWLKSQLKWRPQIIAIIMYGTFDPSFA